MQFRVGLKFISGWFRPDHLPVVENPVGFGQGFVQGSVKFYTGVYVFFKIAAYYLGLTKGLGMV